MMICPLGGSIRAQYYREQKSITWVAVDCYAVSCEAVYDGGGGGGG
jgi:hypothetical protein